MTKNRARGAILEAFKPGTEPSGVRTVIDGGVPSNESAGGPASAQGPRPPVATGGSGLY